MKIDSKSKTRLSRLPGLLAKTSLIAFTAMIFASCGKKELTPAEQKVIAVEIPAEMRKNSINDYSMLLDGYLSECLNEYSEDVRKKVQKNIDEWNQTKAFFGGHVPFDVDELLGTSRDEKMARGYRDYIDYVERCQERISSLVSGMAEVIKENPSALEVFDQEGTISLDAFSGVEGMPSSLSSESLEPLRNLTISQGDRSKWGKELIGDYHNPKLSVGTVVWAVVQDLKDIDPMKPVYAVYDEESDSWEVGYAWGDDVTVAYNVKFKQKGDVMKYEYDDTDYTAAYVGSELNVLKKKK